MNWQELSKCLQNLKLDISKLQAQIFTNEKLIKNNEPNLEIERILIELSPALTNKLSYYYRNKAKEYKEVIISLNDEMNELNSKKSSLINRYPEYYNIIMSTEVPLYDHPINVKKRAKPPQVTKTLKSRMRNY